MSKLIAAILTVAAFAVRRRSPLTTLAGMALVLVAIAALAGSWWSALAAGIALIVVGEFAVKGQ